MARILVAFVGVLVAVVWCGCESQPRAGVQEHAVTIHMPEQADLYLVRDRDWLNTNRDQAALRNHDFLARYQVHGTGTERVVRRPGFLYIAVIEHEGRWGRSDVFNPSKTPELTVAFE